MKNSMKWHVLFGGFAAYMVDAAEISILAIALPNLITDLGISVGQAGLLATAGWIGIGASGIAMGWFADNFGRRRALIGSLLIFGVATAAFGLLPASYPVMLLLRLIAGIGLGGVWAILSAYVAETWPAPQRGRVTMYVLSAYPVGAALAAFAGGILLPDWRLLFVVFGVGALFPAVYAFVFIPESPQWKAERDQRTSGDGANEHASVTEIFREPLLRQTIVGTVAASLALFAYIGLLTWLPTFLVNERGLTAATAAQYLIIFNAGVFVSYFLFGWIADKIGKRIALMVSLALAAVLLSFYTFIPDADVLRWYGGILGLSIVFAGLMGSYFSEIYPIRVRTTGAGFCFNVGRLIASLSPLVLAGAVTAVGYAGALLIAAAMFALAAVSLRFMPSGGAALPPTATADPALAGTPHSAAEPQR